MFQVLAFLLEIEIETLLKHNRLFLVLLTHGKLSSADLLKFAGLSFFDGFPFPVVLGVSTLTRLLQHHR